MTSAIDGCDVKDIPTGMSSVNTLKLGENLTDLFTETKKINNPIKEKQFHQFSIYG